MAGMPRKASDEKKWWLWAKLLQDAAEPGVTPADLVAASGLRDEISRRYLVALVGYGYLVRSGARTETGRYRASPGADVWQAWQRVRDAWREVGKELRARRLLMDPSFANLTRFARERPTQEHPINHRVVWNLERGVFPTYTPESLGKAESAYGLEPGWISQRATQLITGEAPEAAPRLPDPDGYVRPRYPDPELEDLAQYLENRWPNLWHRDVDMYVQMGDALRARREPPANSRSA